MRNAVTKPVVAISLGDPSGIGPEVVALALADDRVRQALVPVVVGDLGVMTRAAFLRGVPHKLVSVTAGTELARRAAAGEGCLFVVSALAVNDASPGQPTDAGGRAQADYLAAALALVRAKHAAALCTAPVNKAAIQRAGLDFVGHTEWLAKQLGVERVVMMLAGEKLRVALATTHLPLARVPAALTTDGLVATLKIVDRELRRRFGVASPVVAVCGLNPHAGEEGKFGDEEQRVITPAIAAAAAEGLNVQGPFAADGLFPRAAAGRFDAVLAMYHDQGLIPVKLLEFSKAVNVTLGLPIVRTSPDHGVAYDIAGTGAASAEPMISALLLAAKLAAG